ncbi:hypothetical protein ACQ4PT_066039 [Festuca glaucescens]
MQSEKQQKQNTTVVSHLPGYQGPLPFSLQTGYVEVDESNGVRFFYYFVQSEGNPAEDPVLLWLAGGPGCSGFSALVYENGPLRFQSHSNVDGLPELVYRPDSWTKVASIIFLDSPVGAGFSYSATEEGYNSDTKTIDQIAIFLTKWYEEHPEFLSNPLYIAGDSYSGLIVPPLTLKIARGMEMGDRPVLNLKGYILGNPLTDRKTDFAARIPYAHRMGLLSDEQYEIYRESCGADTDAAQNVECTNCLESIDKCLKGINIHHILEPECPEYDGNSIGGRILLGHNNAELPLSDICSECREAGYTMSSIWANDKAVREALGVHNAWIRSLGFPVVDEWRPWYVTGEVAGFATVKGAGHTAPEYKPKECLAMMSSWLSNRLL